MKLNIKNNANIEEFELTFSPLTYDIYYAQFNRDIAIDTINTVNIYGGYSRSLSLRLIWSMIKTTNMNFMSFVEFINILEYNINDFHQGWGDQFSKWYSEIMKSDFK